MGGIEKIIPTSVTFTGTFGSVEVTKNGTIRALNVTSMNVNNIFSSAFMHYRFDLLDRSGGGNGVQSLLQFSKAGLALERTSHDTPELQNIGSLDSSVTSSYPRISLTSSTPGQDYGPNEGCFSQVYILNVFSNSNSRTDKTCIMYDANGNSGSNKTLITGSHSASAEFTLTDGIFISFGSNQTLTEINIFGYTRNA